MSDKLNPNDQELTFKERILRDLEILKSQVEEADETAFNQVKSDEETQGVAVAEIERLKADLESKLSGPSEEGQPVKAEEVPDFVAEQARKLSEQSLEPPLRQSVIPEPEAVPYKVDLTFNPEVDPNEEFMETEKAEASSVAPVDASSQSGNEMAPTRRSRSAYPDRAPKKNKKVKKKKSKARKLTVWIFTTLLLVLVATSVAGYFFVKDSLGPVDAKSTEYVQVQIAEGSSVKAIAQTLEKEGVIKNATVFDLYAKVKNLSGFQSGYHQLQKSMNVDEIIAVLQQEGTAEEVVPAKGKVTIPEGYTLKQISEAVAVNAASSTKASSPFTAEEFMSLVTDETFIAEMQAKYPDLLGGLPTADTGVIYRLEGYLFPATYEYQEGTTIRDLVDQMLGAMDANLRPYYETISAKEQTVNQILTLASLVEKEGSSDQDRKNIASVFYNRMQFGMPLQSNIAILYAEGKLGEKITLAEDATINTQIESPYNVYTHLGYMPGPVDSPSLSAIKATIEPSTTEYFYFVADVTTGQVYFANTIEEHNTNVQTYVNEKIQSSTGQ
ncbi:endolytic transglycosylase MltG [Streptococcus merionis]|uniref:Endolytic murein transglycosylase n=1 Tax=Streptococcus merionis TaxID=400065 RepID=A0A239SWH0_9STRE|nr:endolytic transglycosylase MltG [Streptococcus merionis]SNU89084.1 aminodeoxychorismate lyase [Streptococcus merionis]